MALRRYLNNRKGLVCTVLLLTTGCATLERASSSLKEYHRESTQQWAQTWQRIKEEWKEYNYKSFHEFQISLQQFREENRFSGRENTISYGDLVFISRYLNLTEEQKARLHHSVSMKYLKGEADRIPKIRELYHKRKMLIQNSSSL